MRARRRGVGSRGGPRAASTAAAVRRAARWAVAYRSFGVSSSGGLVESGTGLGEQVEGGGRGRGPAEHGVHVARRAGQ